MAARKRTTSSKKMIRTKLIVSPLVTIERGVSGISKSYIESTLRILVTQLREMKIPETRVLASRAVQEIIISIDLVGNARMRSLNLSTRGIRSSTDILSFESQHPVLGGRMNLGELVISWPVAMRQAKTHKHSARNEFLILVVHGLFHLLGMDHEAGALHYKKMMHAEEVFLKEFGKIHGVNVSSGLIDRARDHKNE